MWLNNRRFVFVFLASFIAIVTHAQKLYWVGGSGNFNDPKHWSLQSGGVVANLIPNAKTDVFFDDNSGPEQVEIQFTGVSYLKNLHAASGNNLIYFTGSNASALNISGSVFIDQRERYFAESKIVFTGKPGTVNTIQFGVGALEGDLYFNSGAYNIVNLFVADKNTVYFNGGKFYMQNTHIIAGSIINTNPAVEFDVKNASFKVANQLKIKSDFNFKVSEKMKLAGFTQDIAKFEIPPSFYSSKKYSTQNLANVACVPVISTTPSCSGPCTGILGVSFPAGCTPDNPYDIQVSSGDPLCLPTSNTLTTTGVNVTAGTTYTFGNACTCVSQLYLIEVFDAVNSTAVASTFTNFQGIPIIMSSTATAASCNSVCDGSLKARFTSGLFPLVVNVLPATVTPSTFTVTGTGTFAVNNLCGGTTYTFNVHDFAGCSSSVTRTVSAPAALLANASTKTLNCNSVNNGAFSVSPTGGTPSYTVAFSSGSTLSTTAGGTVSVSSLPAGAISATITDSKGCTATTNTTISQPPAYTITPSQNNLTCPGSCIGTASVAVSGGGGTYNYTWTPGGLNTAGITSLCAGGYTVDIVDNFNCNTSRTFSITQPTSITLTTPITSVTCNSLCNGSASVSATGPTTAVSFTWVASGGIVISTSSLISSRCAGVYTITAKDAPSSPTCVVSKTVAITEPPAYTITPATQSIACLATPCNGSATLTATGGNGAPYSYTWNPGAITSSVATNLCDGDYTVSVIDGGNCPTSTVVNIAKPPTFTANITSTSLTCNGVCSGVINSAPTGGVGPYTFTLVSLSSSLAAAPPFTGLCANIYTLIIKDSSPATCGQSFTVNLQQPNPLALSASVSAVTCASLCNGSIGGNVNGGTPSYTVSWATPTGTVAGGSLSNVCAGQYTFNVRDANSCTASITSSVGEPTDITLSITPTPANCFGSCDGVLSASVTGGSPGYTLNWSNGASGTLNNNLCKGSYSVTVTDSHGCIKTGTSAVGSPSAIVLSQNTVAASCAGFCDGSATITATGGTAPYTFNFNTSPPSTNTSNATGIITGLCAGNYLASITDAHSCPQSTAFSIGSPSALSASVTGIKNSCTACTGAATVTPSNGTPGYSFQWTNSLSVNVSTAATASALCTGDYTITVTDNNACAITTTVKIQQTVITAAVSGGSGIQCFGAATASAVVTPSPIGAYTFTWLPTAQTTQTATGLAAGDYTVTVQEIGGSNCTSSATIRITEPSSLTISTSQTSLTCFGLCNGALTSTVSGGTGAINYSWSPGGQLTPGITNQCAGNYTLRVSDANGCTVAPQSFSIAQPASITAVFSSTVPSGCTLSNGSICATPSGGSGSGYTFSWSPVTGTNTGTGACLTNVTARAYNLIVTDGTGICSTTISTLLNSPAGPTITVAQQSVTCFGASTGAATITAAGTPVFSYTWTPAVAGNTPIASGLPTGTYVVSVQDGNSCVTNQTVEIAEAFSVTINSNVSHVKCSGGSTGSITVNPTGGTGALNFAWSPTSPPITGQGTRTITGLIAINYSLTLTDANSCVTPFVFSVSAPPTLSVSAVSTKSVVCNGLTNGSISATASGGSGVTTLSWTPLGAFSGSTTSTVLGLGPGIYTVVTTDANTCTASAFYTLAASTLTSGIVMQNASCSNSCDATANHTVSGGAPTYSFSWSTGPVTTQSLNGLCTGNYVGSVVDADGCISSQSFTVSPAVIFSLNVNASNPKCNATCDGSVVVIPTGAQGGITYNWLPTAPNSATVTGLCAGGYTLSAIDGSGCATSTVMNLIDPPALLSNVTFTNPLCNNNCNGIAVISPTNAVGAVTALWMPGGATSTAITNLCADQYTVTVTDANGCLDVQTFTLANPPVLNINQSSGPAICPANNNGSITVIPSGGTPGYTYLWSPAVSTASIATGLSAQTYTVEVKDAANCTNTIVIPLSNSNGPTAVVSTTNVLCFGKCTGAASLSAITGLIPVTFSWSPPAISPTANPITNLCAGAYIASLTDGNSCVTFTGATITEPSSITIIPSMGLPTCQGVCNGTISIPTSGGVPAYTYSWTPAAANSSVLTGLCAGDYTVEVGHNGGQCVEPIVINFPAQVNLPLTTNTISNTCFVNCFGLASISLTNATPGIPPPFSFAWSTGQTSVGVTSSTISNLCNGTYSVTVTGSNGCFNTRTVSISSPPQLSLTATVVQPSCNICNGAATLQPSGGTGSSYTFSWSTGATTSSLGNLCAGIYPVDIKDGLNCRQTETVIINNSNGITGETLNKTDIPCGATCSGSATVVAIGGNPPISYNWLSPAVSGTAITNLCAGVYFVQMQDAQGCQRTASTKIDAATSITLSPFITPPNCGLTDGAVNIVAAGGTPTYNFAWLPPGPITGTLVNVGPGSYTLTVTDSSPGGCPTQTIINLSNTTGPQLALNQTNINCFNGCTGSVAVVATGTAPFTYNWNTGATSTSVTNLCQGVITLTVSDVNNCKTVTLTTLTENPKLQINLPQVTQPSCNVCNGLASVNAFGGASPYTYTWTTGASGFSVANLCAGIYQVNITDQLNCKVTETVIINNSSGITGENFTTKDIPCGATCSGAATVSATGTNTPISYNWVNPAISGSVLTNLCPGTYFVQMQDAQGCLRTASTTINSAVNITLTTLVTQPHCQLSDGNISIAPVGGVPGYSFLWSPLGQTSGTLTNLGPGSYTVTVTDNSADGCPTTTMINISNQNGPQVSLSTTDINCFGSCTGSVNAVATGSAPFTYNWNFGGNSPSVTSLCPGLITLTVTDVNACVTIKSATISENPELHLNIPQVTQPSCNQCNGLTTVNAFGGTGPYTYTWTNGAIGNALTGLCAGLYQVIVTDQLNCQSTQNVTINNSSGITGETFLVQDVPCVSNCNGGATVTPIGGAPPYAFNWINPPLTSTGNSAASLCTGAYFVQITDNNGCRRTSSVSVNAATDLTITPTVAQPSCGTGPVFNGLINLTVIGGTPPFTFSWSPVSAASQSLGGLAPGHYTVTVTDQNGSGCSESETFDLSNLSGPSISFSQTNVSCNNLCNGSVSVVATGTSPTTFAWSVPGNTSASISNVCGVVTLTASANGCSTVKTFTIDEPPLLELNLDSISVSCRNKCDGMIVLLPLGGQLAYTFSGTTLPGANQITSVCGGTNNAQSFTVTDANGCSVSKTVSIMNPPALSPSILLNNSSCTSVGDGAATVSLTTPFTATWTGPGGFSSTSTSVSNLFAGVYTVTVINDVQCARDSVVKLPATIVVEANAGLDTIVCPRSNITLNGGKSLGAQNYKWTALNNPGVALSSNSLLSLPEVVGSFTYELVVTSSVQTCFDADTILVNSFNEPSIEAGPSYTIPVFSTVTIGGNPTYAGIENVIWSPDFYLNDATLQNPIATNTVSTTFTVSVGYGKGCVVSDSTTVYLYPEVKVNSGFSPNGDGKNDKWLIDYLEQFPDNTVEIYNRWGEQLFFQRGYHTPFDGTYKGKNLPVGTYYYVIHLNHPAYPKPITGPLTLFR